MHIKVTKSFVGLAVVVGMLVVAGCVLPPPGSPLALGETDMQCDLTDEGLTVTTEADSNATTPETVTVKGLNTNFLSPGETIGTVTANTNRLGPNEVQRDLVRDPTGSYFAFVDADGNGVPSTGEPTIQKDSSTGDLTITTNESSIDTPPGTYQMRLFPGALNLPQMPGRTTLQVIQKKGTMQATRNMVFLNGNVTILPQVAAGPVGNDTIDTTVIVTNSTSVNGNMMMQCWGQDGSPMSVSINGNAASSTQSFVVAAKGAKSLRVGPEAGQTGPAPLQVGWCEVSGDVPFGASSRFRTLDTAGKVVGEAGISGVDHVSNRFVASVDKDASSGRDTALAIVNLSDQPATVTVVCSDHASPDPPNTLALGPENQVAMFSDELCNLSPGFPVDLINITSDSDLAVMSLLTKNGSQQSSLPVSPRGLGVYSK